MMARHQSVPLGDDQIVVPSPLAAPGKKVLLYLADVMTRIAHFVHANVTCDRACTLPSSLYSPVSMNLVLTAWIACLCNSATQYPLFASVPQSPTVCSWSVFDTSILVNIAVSLGL